jgi:lipoate-protein ligase A
VDAPVLGAARCGRAGAEPACLTPPWQVEIDEGPAATLHEASAALLLNPGPLRPTVRVLAATDRAVVLGSTQPESQVDPVRAAAAGASVVRRRSGGGAVLVGPGLVVWVDVLIPAGGPLWEADVGRAFWWLGSAWVGALARAGLPGGEVWRRGLQRSRWSPHVCFAGLGPGEVTVGGAKVVGLAQRRTRQGALFQCAVPVVWDPAALLDLLALDDEARTRGSVQLAGVAAGVGPDVARHLVPALVAELR